MTNDQVEMTNKKRDASNPIGHFGLCIGHSARG
jgi:hypothetical protein